MVFLEKKLQDRVFRGIKSIEVTFRKIKINLYLSSKIDFTVLLKQEETFDVSFQDLPSLAGIVLLLPLS